MDGETSSFKSDLEPATPHERVRGSGVPDALPEHRYDGSAMARIGIFGGSFNPVHNGHVIMALRARESADLDRVMLVPAATPPHKPDVELLDSSLRLACLHAAFNDLDGCDVDARELARGDLSYTVDTLEFVAAENPEADLFFILGADSVAMLPTWRDIPRLAELATFLWIPRPGIDKSVIDAIRTEFPRLELEPVPCPLVGISASEIRARRDAGLSLAGWVPDAVADLLADSAV
ncbi:MAG: nicotinate (nicotinamide) nucleotide adenylyltransferase [Planctomycetes bacterium]|nr:nicotinate (nicotinamide) nucleotide adenylyltransferase [Planctomycetota bacterium]